MASPYYAETVHSSSELGNSAALVVREPGTKAQSFDYSYETSAFHTATLNTNNTMNNTPIPLVPITTQALTSYRPPSPLTSRPSSPSPPPPSTTVPRTHHPQLIATISAGFEKGDYLIREEKGSNIYFDFFEEAFNFISQKGYTRMNPREEEEYLEIIKRAHKSVPGGCRFNTGRLLMVLRKKLIPVRVSPYEGEDEPLGQIMEEEEEVEAVDGSLRSSSLMMGSKESTTMLSSSSKRKKGVAKDKLTRSTNTLPTDSESSAPSSAYSSASTSCVDSWE